jgi:hypothetical protein
MALSPLTPAQVEAARLAGGGAQIVAQPPPSPPYPPGWTAPNAGSTGQLSPPVCRIQGGAFAPLPQGA